MPAVTAALPATSAPTTTITIPTPPTLTIAPPPASAASTASAAASAAAATPLVSPDAVRARGGRAMTTLGVEAWGDEEGRWDERSKAARTEGSPTFFVRNPQKSEWAEKSEKAFEKAHANKSDLENGKDHVCLASPVHGPADPDVIPRLRRR